MRRPDPAFLDALFQAIHDSVGPCRFEATTFRTVGLAIPTIRAAAEDLMGRTLLQEELQPTADGATLGRLSKEAFRMFSTSQMRTVWPSLVQDWRIGLCTDADWIAFFRSDEPVPMSPPPRIDHLTEARLPYTWVPVDEGWLLPGVVCRTGRQAPWKPHRLVTRLRGREGPASL
jgi:hypothetical protein